MTSVHIPRDDAASKISTTTDRTVQAATPYPSVQPVKAHEDATKAPERTTHKNLQRRKKERRKDNAPVLLDTRSGHDRRNADHLIEEDQDTGTEKSARTGINVFS